MYQLFFVSTLIFINKAKAEIPFISLGEQSLKIENQRSNSAGSVSNEIQVIPEGNLGDEYQRAYYLNELRQQDPTTLPQVNYMGWYINRFANQIRAHLK
jgi:hypothetical protein